jgi:DNA (cytosine-5)-methyltransferase 1
MEIRPEPALRVADFFCGGGGFSEGFRQAGFNIVFAVDKWEPAVRTYRGNKPGVNVVQDDIIRISNLPDEDFERIVPDSEVIIGSPPCQSFSHSNKSGNADKSLGITLIEAYLKIIARKKMKQGSVLRYWVLENVPAVKDYIKDEYVASDFGLEGDLVLKTKGGASGKYNAKYFGAPTNRERYLCGDFPELVTTKNDATVVTLRQVLDSLGDPLSEDEGNLTDINYPTLTLKRSLVTDHRYVYKLADFEIETAKRLKQDKGYMGRMAFPENLDKPARTVMATMSCSSREAMILPCKDGGYRLPTVREAACMMSFPIDYWFYGNSKGTKHTLVGNAVPPKLSYAVAKAIAKAEHREVPERYPLIQHDADIQFYDLNGAEFDIKEEKPRRATAKFKYHIPYLIIDAYRVELTNYHSDFENERYTWTAEIHHGQGKNKAVIYVPVLRRKDLPRKYLKSIDGFIDSFEGSTMSMDMFQKAYCMTAEKREQQSLVGPFELLDMVKKFIADTISVDDMQKEQAISAMPYSLPIAITVG